MKTILPLFLFCLTLVPPAYADTAQFQAAIDCNSIQVTADRSENKAIDQLCSTENFWGQSSEQNLLNPRMQYLATPLFVPQSDATSSEGKKLILDRLTGGIALGLKDTDMESDFGGEDTGDYTIAGYLSYLINDNFSLDFTAGRGVMDLRQDQVLSDPSDTSFLDANHMFYFGSLSGLWIIDQWTLGAHFGYLASRDRQYSYEYDRKTGVDVYSQEPNMWQMHSGLDLAYAFQSSFEPYIGVGYLRDSRRNLSTNASDAKIGQYNGNDQYQFSAGLRYLGKNGFSSNLKFNVSSDREEIDFSSLILLLRLDL